MEPKSAFQLKVEEMISLLATEVCDELDKAFFDVIDTFDVVAMNFIADHNITDQNELLAISKAGTYIRYAAEDLINAMNSEKTYDPVAIVMAAMDRKIEEDTIHEEDEKEVERLINETEDIIGGVEEDFNNEENTDIEEEEVSETTEEDVQDLGRGEENRA